VESRLLVKVHTKLHLGLEWHIFHILTSEDIDDVISHFYTVVCAKILKIVYIMKKITWWLEDMNFIFSW